MDTVSPSDRMEGGTHYLETKVQPWAIIEDWSHPDQSQFEAYLWGNTLKYIHRYRRKGTPHQDIDKAIHYLTKLKEYL